MDRRDFLKKTSAAAAATASGTALVGATGTSGSAHAAPHQASPLAAPTVAGAAIRLRVSIPGGSAITGPADNARRLLRDIELASGGRYRFDIFPAGSGAPGFSDILTGNADAAFASPHEDMPRHKAFAYFAGLPAGLGMDAAGLQSWMVMGGSGLLDELTSDFGVKSLLAGHLGTRPALWTWQQINSLEDLKAMRLAVPGLAHDVLAAAGVAFPGGYRWTQHNAASQFASGEADAADVGGAFTALQSDITDEAAFAYDGAINPHGSTLALHFSAAVWNGMPDADRLIITSLAANAYQSSLTENLAHEAMARQVASAGKGIVFKPMPPEIATVVTGVSGAILAHTATIDRLSERINARYMAFKRVLDEAANPHPPASPTA